MKIIDLPNKEQLTHFNVQYYYNDVSGKGSSKHVITVKYSTHPEPYKYPHKMRVAKFYLRSEVKEINRMVKKHWLPDDCEMVKGMLKENKKAELTTRFGFRIQEYKLKHKFVKGQLYHKRQTDANTCVIFEMDENNQINLRFIWGGQPINVKLTLQNPETYVPRQSLAYAFWENKPTTEDLIERIKVLKNGTKTHDEDTDGGEDITNYDVIECNDAELVCEDGAGQADEGKECETSETATDSSKPEPEQLGGLGGRNGESNTPSQSYEEPIADTATRSRAPKRVRGGKSGTNDPFVGTAYDRQVLDRFEESPFSDDTYRAPIDLGTTFRF